MSHRHCVSISVIENVVRRRKMTTSAVETTLVFIFSAIMNSSAIHMNATLRYSAI